MPASLTITRNKHNGRRRSNTGILSITEGPAPPSLCAGPGESPAERTNAIRDSRITSRIGLRASNCNRRLCQILRLSVASVRGSRSESVAEHRLINTFARLVNDYPKGGWTLLVTKADV